MMKSPSNSAVIYAGTRSGIWKSVDHGETWGKTRFPDIEVLSIGIAPDNQNILYVGTGDSGVFTSTDSGDSWKAFNEGLGVLHVTRLAVSETEPKMLYAGTAFGGLWQYDISEEKCAANVHLPRSSRKCQIPNTERR
jgi:photosystem II stability/assembly factor-like uncharacterized protein